MDNKPIFVRIEEFKEVRDLLKLLRGKVKDAKQTLSAVDTLKRQEEQELRSWNAEIDDVERRLDFIEKVLSDSVQQ